MPYILSFDLATGPEASPDNRTRIRLIFQRFGWQAVGGTCVQYPPMGKQMAFEDFFGKVLPALWLFRCLVIARYIKVKAYTFTAHSTVSYHHEDSAEDGLSPVATLSMLPAKGAKSTQNRMSEPIMRKALQATELALA